MSIIRIQHDKEKPYVMLNRQALQDPLMSWEAKGLWAFLLSMKDDWQVCISHLVKVYQGPKRGGKRDRIYAMLKELEDLGYVVVTQKKSQNGRFGNIDYTVYESKQAVNPKDKIDKTKPELKKKVPNQDKPETDKPLAVKQPLTIRNDKKEICKRNDINVNEDRSSYQDSEIVLFDPKTFRLPNGENLSIRMQRSLEKYSNEDKAKLNANVCYFLKMVKKGVKMDNPEAYLQNCIKMNYAQKATNSFQNEIYAKFMKVEHKMRGITILKTVVQLKKNYNEPPQSLSYTLPPSSFAAALNNYIEIYKEQEV